MKKTGMDKLFDKYVKRIQSGDTKAMNEIALIFQNNYEDENAEKWFLKAIEAGDYEYANNLGYLYANRHDFENAEKYYLMGKLKRQKNIIWSRLRKIVKVQKRICLCFTIVRIRLKKLRICICI